MLNMGDDTSVAFYNTGKILFLTAHMEMSAAAITTSLVKIKVQLYSNLSLLTLTSFN